MSDYIVSARKYRPDSFETLIGQDNIARTLRNSILRNQLAHAYLFCGPRGVGKTSAARIFAKTINCSNPGPDMEPCGQCESCLSFKEGRSYCIHELDAASNNGVDDIKALMEKVQIPPQVGKYSVYIIDEVHMLSQAAFNAFLKTLEEPPSHAIFILATTEKHKIIPTILSRCQTYDFNRISVPDIVKNLSAIATREGVRIDGESLHVIAGKADGAMRDALTIFDQTVAFCGSDIHYEDVIRNLNVLDYEYGFRLVDAFLAKDYGTALLIFDEVLSKGFNALYFVSSLGTHFRDLLVSRTGGLDSLLDLPDSLRERYRTQASGCTVKFLFDALSIVNQCEAGYRAATNQRLHIEYALMRLSFLGGVPESSAKAVSVDSPAVSAQTSAAPASKPAAPVAATSFSPVPSVKSTAPTVPEPDAPVAAAPSVKPVAPAPDAGIPETAAPAFSSDKWSAAPAQDAVVDLDTDIEPVPIIPGEPVEAPTRPEPAVKAESEPVKHGPRGKRAVKTGSAFSLASLLEEDDDILDVVPVADEKNVAVLPDDSVLEAAWKELAASQSQPRLANALASARLEFRPEGDAKFVDFLVTNEAQKRWIEERILRSLESRFQQMTGCSRVFLKPTVRQEEQAKMLYTPLEKAQDLMSKNGEVASFLADFGLDIK